MTETRYIVALCPVTPRYLHRDTAEEFRAEGKYATSDKEQARLFDTFDAAMAFVKSIRGWGGASRVEEIAVEVPEVPSLATPAGRIEARDAATECWHEWADRIAEGDITTSAERTTMAGLHFVRNSMAIDFDARVTADECLHLTAYDGSTLTLEWDPMVDGFDYPTSGDDGCELDEEQAQPEDESASADADAEERAEQDESPVAFAEARIDEAIEGIGALVEESADIGRGAAILLLANLIALAQRKGLDWQAIEDAAWATADSGND